MRNIISALLLFTLTNAGNAFAVNYYVNPNGSDNANGLSHATAWKSVGKVNKFSFNAGDDVYFLSGGRWNKQIKVDWNGTTTNQTIVGSYYMSNGTEKIGVKPGTRRPTFIGGYPLLNVAGAMPTSNWQAMVQVKANYVTIQNLRVEKSSGSGIILDPGHHHAIFENNEVDVTAGSSMIFYRRTHSNIMRNNKMRKCAQAWRDKIWTQKAWPICNGAVGSRDNLIENNVVTESYGEGIVAFAVRANNNIIRGNTIVVVRTAGIYIDNGANNIVENNLVVGASSGGRYKGTAFALSVEDYKYMRDATGNIFRNNLAANTKNCFWMGVEPAAQAKGYKVGGKFIGNTCIGMKGSIKHFDTANDIQEFQVSNNIFYDMPKNSCKFPNMPKAIFSNNLWQVRQRNKYCQGDGDVIADPMLRKSSGWKDINHNKIPSVTDFVPQAGSPVYGSGLAMTSMDKDYYGGLRPPKPAIGAFDISNSILTNDSD